MRFARVARCCCSMRKQRTSCIHKRCRRAQPPRVGTSLDDFPAARCTDAVPPARDRHATTMAGPAPSCAPAMSRCFTTIEAELQPPF